jgi:hypothetical protein
MKSILLAIFASVLSLTSFAANKASFTAGQPAPGIENSVLSDISEDAAGNSFVTGTVTSQGYNEVFIAKYDADGSLQWVKAGNGGGHYGNNSYSITLDEAGNAYITGTFSGTAVFDSYKLQSQGAANMFIAKYDAAGNIQWASQANGNSYESQVRGNEIAVANGELVVKGQVLNHAEFGSQSISGTGIYEAHYSTNGQLVSVAMVQ